MKRDIEVSDFTIIQFISLVVNIRYTNHMKIILGLGNPETRYEGTRHNVGFMLLDEIASHWNATYHHSDRFRADIAETSVEGEKVLLVKPTTYYNLVGESARSLLDFYKCSLDDILIIHDDLALPLGTVRTRIGGSDGGNNGLKSLAQHIGSETARLRVGTWIDVHHGSDKVAVVLGKLSAAEREILNAMKPILFRNVTSFIDGSFESTTHRHEPTE